MAKRRYALDDGHGMGTAGKRTDKFTDGTKSPDTGENFMRENEFNRAVVKYLGMHLKASGFDVFYTAPTDADTPLKDRTDFCDKNDIDVLVSVHANALTGKFSSGGKGIETFVYMGGSGASEKLGRIIHREVLKGTSLTDRGVKNGNHLWMIRTPKAAAILLELGFMDNLREAKLLLSDAYRRESAEEVARAICIYEGKPFVNGVAGTAAVKPSSEGKMYRVRKTWADAGSQAGAFAELQNAKDKADEKLLTVFDEDGRSVYVGSKDELKVWYRVRKTWADADSQKGAFYDLNSAKDLADDLSLTVFDESGKTIYIGKKAVQTTPKPEPVVDAHEGHFSILGKAEATKEQMLGFLKEKNATFSDAEEVVEAFLEVGIEYGIRGDVAFCQSLIETGWFKFNGGTAVTPDQHNYCGMGVVSKGVKGNSFETVKDGVKAQLQHLYAYATKAELPDSKVLDPRFHLVNRGSAPHWEDLSMKWAMNENYGKHILEMYQSLLEFVSPKDLIEEALNSFPKWAHKDARLAIEAGLTDGSRPNDAPTRMEVIVMMGRLLGKVEEIVAKTKES